MKRLVMDFETRSTVDLKKAGAYKYSLDSSTIPTCLAFKVRGKPIIYFLDFKAVNRQWSDQPFALRNMWMRFIYEEYEFTAHNAFFERCIYHNVLFKRYGWPSIPFKQYRCTAAKAAACALPRNLEGAGESLKLSIQKDRRGYIAMMKTCKPTKEWNAWNKLQEEWRSGKKLGAKKMERLIHEGEPTLFLSPQKDPQTWETLYTYCKIDVKSEEQLDIALPDLIPDEQERWQLNQTLNWRGLRIDIPTAKKVVGMIAEESKVKLRELDHLTMGLVTKPGARKSIMEFLMFEGVELKNLQAKTVQDKMDEGNLSDDMKRLLEIRQALSKTSTKKYQSMIDRAGVDDRVRDILLYHGASTGRDSGTGIQPHNFPRGLMKVQKGFPYAHVDNVATLTPEMIRIVYGDSLGILFSAILRNMIIPSDNHQLYVADFSKIEVAVLWWLADNEPGLKVLREKRDPYKYQAAANTGKTYEEIADEGEERQLAKGQILGCGFGLGWKGFQRAAWDLYRLKLTDKQSKLAVKMYRETNRRVPELWKEFEAAAIHVVKNGGTMTAGKCEFIYNPIKRYGGCRFLWVTLPSGRRLAYADPRVLMRMREFQITEYLVDGEWIRSLDDVEEDSRQEFLTREVSELRGPYETLEFFAVNPKTKKWGVERTWGGTLTENIVQAVARDLMMPAMVRLEKAGYKALLSVHDEALTEKPIGEGSIEEFTNILCEVPPWGAGLPIDAKGWCDRRYRK